MTFQAFTPDLLRQLRFINILKAQFFKKIGMISKGEDLRYPKFLSLSDAGRDKFPADAGALRISSHRKGADLCKVFPEDMQCADTFNLAVVFADKDIPYVFIEVIQGAGDHLSLSCKFIDELVDDFYVSYACFPYAQYIVSLL